MVTAPTVVDPRDWNYEYNDREEMIFKQNALNEYRYNFSVQLAAMCDELNIEFQYVEETRLDITNKSGQVAADRQAVTQMKTSVDQSKTHIDQQKQAIDTTAGQVSQNAQQVASDKQVVAQDKQAAADSAQAAGESAGQAEQSMQAAQDLYQDLDAVNTAKTQSQQAATTASQQRQLAQTARQGAETAQQAAETAAQEANVDIDAAINANNEEFGIGEPIEITPNLLAEVIEPGDYWVATNSPTDKPITRFCWLFVRRASAYTNVTQELVARDSGWERYARTSDDNGETWSAWSLSFSTGNLLNIGTTAVSARAALNLGTAATVNISAFATAAQGDLADSALQSGDLASVAFTGAYSALTGKPSLGTAASADVQTNPLNNNSGRVLLVGAGGLLTNRSGVPGQTPPIATDLNTTYSTGFWGTDGGTLNNPDNRTVTGVIVASDTARTYQIQITYDDDLRFRSGDSHGFTGWRGVWHTGNFDPADVGVTTGSNSYGRYYLYPDGRLVMHCGPKTFSQDPTSNRRLLASVTLPYTPLGSAEHYVTVNPSSDAGDYTNASSPFDVSGVLVKPGRLSSGTVVEIRLLAQEGRTFATSATTVAPVLIESRWK